jgi:hypothetical protein
VRFCRDGTVRGHRCLVLNSGPKPCRFRGKVQTHETCIGPSKGAVVPSGSTAQTHASYTSLW